MEPLFRLALIRPAVTQDPANPSIRIAQDSTFQRALAEASKAEQPRQALQRVARDFVAGADFIGNPDANALNAQLAALAVALGRLERDQAVSHADVVKAVNEAFGSVAEELVESQELSEAFGPVPYPRPMGVSDSLPHQALVSTKIL